MEKVHRPSATWVSVNPAGAWPKVCEMRSCWATSAITVRLPARAAVRPSAAATVVLPTPPLPVT